MNDPNAWARRALDLARKADEPSRADRARVRALLLARCMLEPSLVSAAEAASSAASGKAALGSSGLLSKALVAFGIGGAAGAVTSAGVLELASTRAPVSAPATSSASPEVKPQPAPQSQPPEPPPVASASEAEGASNAQTHGAASKRGSFAAIPAPPAASTEAVPVPSKLSAELDALRRAQRLLHAGDFLAALEALGELDRRLPDGVLGEERAATRAIAACAARGRDRARAAEFSRRYPSSVHFERVNAACEVQDTEPRGSRH